MFLIVYYLIVSALAAKCTQDTNTADCVKDKCEMVGTKEVCTECNTAGNVPIDGTCTKVGDAASGKCKQAGGTAVGNTDTKCGKCEGTTFMFKGGCYEYTKTPGSAMCKTAQDGKCTAAVETKEYFVPPDADNTHDSVVSCGDSVTGVTIDNKQYKGVANCLKCTAPGSGSADAPKAATCDECASGYFVDAGKEKICSACAENCLTCTDGTDTNCKSCTADTHFLGAADKGQGKCISCGDATGSGDWKGITGCAKCTKPKTAGAATCTECQTDKYLKTETSGTSCVASNECTGGFFPMTDTADSNKKKCLACSTADKGGIDGCSACELLPSTTRASTVLISCSACSKNNLSPLKNECMQNCPAGTYANSNICKPCHTSCAGCKDDNTAASCTACYPGSVLSYGSDSTRGTCIRECTGALMAHCKADGCTLDVGGSRYCDACEDGYAPIDGVCTAVTAGARDASGCTAKGGKCTACTGNNYALLSGGCYNTKALPGMAVCTVANGGQCSQCANGQQYTNNNCPACAEGCSACTSGNTQQCTKCLAGYYLDSTASKCVKCSENSNSITGIPNCVSCAPPSNGGAVTCYVKTSGGGSGDNSTGGNSDPNLSTGAIAGISVAVIAVVGGLVGFLCWWFVCRGKA